MSVYSQVPTELWYKIFEYLGYNMVNRRRCIFINKNGTVCKKNRIKTDNGDEIWCKAHGKVLLKRFNQDNAEKKYKLTILTDYKKNILTKDLTGTATDYQLLLNTTVNINQIFLDKEKKYTLKFTDRFNIKKFDDKFEEDSYERLIKKNFSNTLISKITFNLSSK